MVKCHCIRPSLHSFQSTSNATSHKALHTCNVTLQDQAIQYLQFQRRKPWSQNIPSHNWWKVQIWTSQQSIWEAVKTSVWRCKQGHTRPGTVWGGSTEGQTPSPWPPHLSGYASPPQLICRCGHGDCCGWASHHSLREVREWLICCRGGGGWLDEAEVECHTVVL